MAEDTQSTQQSPKTGATNGAGAAPHRAEAQPRVALIGRAGAGKTALALALFGAPPTSAATGDIARYQDDATPVIVDDLPGWVNGSESSLTALFSQLEHARTAGQPFVAIWYALDAASARVTDYELQLIRRFAQRYPVVLVLTRTDMISEDALAAMRSAIDEATIPNCLGVVAVAADPLPALGIAPYGVSEVVVLTTQYAEQMHEDIPDHQEAASERIAQPDSHPEAQRESDQIRHSHPPTGAQRASSHDERMDEETRDGTDYSYSSATTGFKPPWALIAVVVVALLALALLLGRGRRNSAS